MTKKEVADNAVTNKHSGYNCAQAVVKALGENYGLSDDAQMHLLMAADGFAVGMGTMETTCGALIGANLIAGIRTEGAGTITKSKEMFADFKAACGGASICKDLKGRDTGVVLCECDNCVRNAVEVAMEVLDEL